MLPELGVSAIPWQPVILRGDVPIATDTIGRVLSSEGYRSPLIVRVNESQLGSPTLVASIASQINVFLGSSADIFQVRLAIFPLAPISGCAVLGHLLTNRVRTRLFQFHRDEQSWTWAEEGLPRPVAVAVATDGPRTSTSIRILVCISANVDPADIDSSGVPQGPTIKVSVANGSTTWLRNESQLGDLRRALRTAFEMTLARWPAAETWHILYAGPAPGAVVLGQEISPTMAPP
ncbi:MAG: SAVED domain-containing protein, partial [Chloroflexi bacterium]|nr:SAVED domain-containing protein [Chloroflexota bacterium]